MAVLSVVRGAKPGAIIPLDAERTLLGRHPNCHIVFDNAAISRHHAQILESHGSYYIEDLRSRNGTYLNGQLLDGRIQLAEGDQIRMSDVVLTFQGSSSTLMSDPSSEPSTTLEVMDQESRGEQQTQEMSLSNEEESRIFLIQDQYEEPSFTPQVVGKLDSGTSADSRSEIKPEVKLRAVLDISRALGGELRIEKLLPSLLSKLFESFPKADQGFILLKEPESGRLRVMATKSRMATKKGEAVAVSMTVVREAMETGKALLSANIQDDSRFSKSTSLTRMRIRSMMCVPLLDHSGHSLGVIQIVTRRPDFEFGKDDLDMLDAVAAQAALAIENAKMHEELLEQREYERDLEFATQVQLGFLPKSKPKVEGYAFADYYEAALRVGGDYFDYVSLPQGRIALAIGDVAGKGMPAALLMARLYSSTRFQLLTNDSVAEAVTGLNAELSSSGLGHRFITFLVMVLDPAKHQLTLVNAGHPAPLLFHKDEEVVTLAKETSSLPLGIIPEQVYQETTLSIRPGDSVVAFTDGVTEAMSENRDIYGRRRLAEYLAGMAEHPIDEVIKGLIADVERFTGEGPARDDTCAIGFSRAPS